MLRMTKSNVAIATVLASIPVMIFFQNCAQTAPVNAGDSSAVNASPTTDSMIIVTPNRPNESLQASDGTDIVTDDIVDSGKGSIGRCNDLSISDILLKIASISMSLSNPTELGFEIVDSNKSISLDKLTLKIKALKTDKARELYLLLSSDGNKILSTENVAMDLITPSEQSLGIKVKLLNDVSVEEGHIYELELAINPSEQIVTNKSKCIFRPIIREAVLSAL
jgi:hypothetical protein